MTIDYFPKQMPIWYFLLNISSLYTRFSMFQQNSHWRNKGTRAHKYTWNPGFIQTKQKLWIRFMRAFFCCWKFRVENRFLYVCSRPYLQRYQGINSIWHLFHVVWFDNIKRLTEGLCNVQLNTNTELGDEIFSF